MRVDSLQSIAGGLCSLHLDLRKYLKKNEFRLNRRNKLNGRHRLILSHFSLIKSSKTAWAFGNCFNVVSSMSTKERHTFVLFKFGWPICGFRCNGEHSDVNTSQQLFSLDIVLASSSSSKSSSSKRSFSPSKFCLFLHSRFKLFSCVEFEFEIQ